MLVSAPVILVGILFVNVWTVIRFWQDKVRAVAGERRIAESDLLGLAIIGGTLGAFLARQLFRHKTRKEPFSTYLQVIAMIQTGLIVGLVVALG